MAAENRFVKPRACVTRQASEQARLGLGKISGSRLQSSIFPVRAVFEARLRYTRGPTLAVDSQVPEGSSHHGGKKLQSQFRRTAAAVRLCHPGRTRGVALGVFLVVPPLASRQPHNRVHKIR